MFEVNGVNGGSLRESIRRWLDEDVGTGDVTTMTTVPANHESDAVIHAKQPGVVAGLPVAKAVFAEVDPGLVFVPLVPEGGRIERGTVLATVTGNTRAILIAERLVLNLLQRLSGVATTTRAFVDAVEGLPVRISDTRKTTPGLRVLEKYAVRVGGGHSHRFGLYDAVLIKDNHIKAAGGVARAIGAAKAQLSHTMKIEVEVETLEQLDEALEAGADIFSIGQHADRRHARGGAPHPLRSSARRRRGIGLGHAGQRTGNRRDRRRRHLDRPHHALRAGARHQS